MISLLGRLLSQRFDYFKYRKLGLIYCKALKFLISTDLDLEKKMKKACFPHDMRMRSKQELTTVSGISIFYNKHFN